METEKPVKGEECFEGKPVKHFVSKMHGTCWHCFGTYVKGYSCIFYNGAVYHSSCFDLMVAAKQKENQNVK